jgi:hypothetical protein
MSINIKILNTDNMDAYSQSTYSIKDYSLATTVKYTQNPLQLSAEINKQLGIRTHNLQVIYDTLTVTFDGENLRLNSIDSYTNKDKWITKVVSIPKIESEGICLAESLADDRISIDIDPKYFFDRDKQLLFIELVKAEDERFYSLSKSLVVGIHNGTLSSILLLNLALQS